MEMVEKDTLAQKYENEELIGRDYDNLVDVREKPQKTNPNPKLSS